MFRPDTPTPIDYYYYDPTTEEEFEDYRAEIRPRLIYPGKVTLRRARVTCRDIARHTCERPECLLCLPYRK